MRWGDAQELLYHRGVSTWGVSQLYSFLVDFVFLCNPYLFSPFVNRFDSDVVYLLKSCEILLHFPHFQNVLLYFDVVLFVFDFVFRRSPISLNLEN